MTSHPPPAPPPPENENVLRGCAVFIVAGISIALIAIGVLATGVQ